MSYSKLAWTAVIAAFAASIGAAPAAAKGGGAKAKQPTVRVTSAKAKPVKVAKAGPTATAGAKAKGPTVKVKAAGGGSATKANGSRTASAKPAVATKEGTPALTSAKRESSPFTSAKRESEPNSLTSAKREANSPFSSAKESQPQDTNPIPTVPLNKAQQLLMKNDNLRMKMQERLGGLDPILAASDFRNLGQFVAAVNASYNDPTIQFVALKALMTGDPPMSLGQAKQQLRNAPPPVVTVTTTVPTTTDQR